MPTLSATDKEAIAAISERLRGLRDNPPSHPSPADREILTVVAATGYTGGLIFHASNQGVDVDELAEYFGIDPRNLAPVQANVDRYLRLCAAVCPPSDGDLQSVGGGLVMSTGPEGGVTT